jgi:hypothetical protein
MMPFVLCALTAGFVSCGHVAIDTAKERVWFVSPKAGEQGNGTKAKPFRNINEGIEAARITPGHDTVVLLAGTHSLAAPIRLNGSDSNLTLRGEPGRRPVISGGTAIKNWRTVENGWWAAKVSPPAQQLYIHAAGTPDAAARRYRPRLPKSGAYTIAGNLPPNGSGHDALQSQPGTFNSAWQNQADIQVNIFQIWTMAKLPLAAGGIDSKSGRIQLAGATHGTVNYANIAAGRRYIIENVWEALSDPGEFYYDRRGQEVIYIPQPGEKPSKVTAVAPAIDQLLIANDVRNLTLENLTFAHTAYSLPAKGDNFAQAEIHLPAALTFTDSNRITINDVEVRNTGAWALDVTNGSSDVTINKCKFVDLGAGGIKVGETSYRADANKQTHGVTIQDTLIAHGGRIHPAAVGIWLGHAHHNLINHNDITDFYYTAISPGWSWGYEPSGAHHNEISWNRITNIGQSVLSDMGGIYTLGVSPGTVLHHNWISDIQSVDYGGWGIYFDEGSTGIVAENNIAVRTTSAPFHQHYGKDNVVRNNILGFGIEAQLMRTRPEPHLSFTIERNVVIWSDGPLLGSNWSGEPGKNFMVGKNIYWNTKGIAPKLAPWDTSSIIADPAFRNVAKDDFRVDGSSPVHKVGFVPFTLDGAGRRNEKRYTAVIRRAWPSSREK